MNWGIIAITLFIDILLLAFLVCTALAIVKVDDLFAAVMLTGIYGFLSAGFFVLMDAVDVAFTEAAVGAGIAPLLMFSTLALTGRFQQSTKTAYGALALVVSVGLLLIFATLDMPSFGSPDAPVHKHLSPRYLFESMSEVGVPNVVTSVLASYRAFDTLGETAVIFTAGVGVLSILLVTPHPTPPVPSSLHEHRVLRIVGKIFIPPILLFALYVQFHGDYGPGGGFQAGVIFAAGLILYSMLFGAHVFEKVIKHSVIRLFAAIGVLLYGTVGVLGILTGENYLDYDRLGSNPIAGQHIGILVIELGVGITVACVMMLIYFAFADYRHMKEGNS